MHFLLDYITECKDAFAMPDVDLNAVWDVRKLTSYFTCILTEASYIYFLFLFLLLLLFFFLVRLSCILFMF